MAEAFKNFANFKSTIRNTKLLCLKHDRFMFSEKSFSTKKLHLLNNRNNRHYSIITNFKGAMAKQYICNGCAT